MLRVGSLCTGAAGLEMAVREVFGDINLVFVADNNPGAAKILAYRHPSVLNIGDISKAQYAQFRPIDLLTAGFPCTDVSTAGKREGLKKNTRTGLWFEVARAIRELRPEGVFLENVHGLLSGKADSEVEWCPWCMGDRQDGPFLRALGCVLADLAEMGYDARWCSVRASDVGAPHRRERIFIWAAPDPEYHEEESQQDIPDAPQYRGGGAAAYPDDKLFSAQS